MRKSFKFRLYPNRRQRQLLVFTLQSCQQLYNAALEQKRLAWRRDRKSVSCFSQAKQLPEVKSELPEYNLVYSQVLQDVLRRLDGAFKAFFRRIKSKADKAGYPRFKAFDRYNSFTYPQANKGCVKFNNKKVWFSKIGAIRVRQHREIKGVIKTATIKREGNHWYAIFSCDNVPLKPLPASQKTVGIDMGVSKLATLSDGSVVENPQHLKKSLAKLKATQQKLAKKKRGTSARRKARQRVAGIYRKVANQRRDFLHKLSRKLVNEYGFIAVENLSIQKLLQLKGEFKKQATGLHRSIGDVGWGIFIGFLLQKAEEAAGTRRVIKVNPRGTTRTCSRCGKLAAKLPLSQREFVCPDCGFRLDRDFNASLNILRLGHSLAQKRRSS